MIFHLVQDLLGLCLYLLFVLAAHLSYLSQWKPRDAPELGDGVKVKVAEDPEKIKKYIKMLDNLLKEKIRVKEKDDDEEDGVEEDNNNVEEENEEESD